MRALLSYQWDSQDKSRGSQEKQSVADNSHESDDAESYHTTEDVRSRAMSEHERIGEHKHSLLDREDSYGPEHRSSQGIDDGLQTERVQGRHRYSDDWIEAEAGSHDAWSQPSVEELRMSPQAQGVEEASPPEAQSRLPGQMVLSTSDEAWVRSVRRSSGVEGRTPSSVSQEVWGRRPSDVEDRVLPPVSEETWASPAPRSSGVEGHTLSSVPGEVRGRSTRRPSGVEGHALSSVPEGVRDRPARRSSGVEGRTLSPVSEGVRDRPARRSSGVEGRTLSSVSEGVRDRPARRRSSGVEGRTLLPVSEEVRDRPLRRPSGTDGRARRSLGVEGRTPSSLGSASRRNRALSNSSIALLDELSCPTHWQPPAIEMKGVGHVYRSSEGVRRVVENVDLTFRSYGVHVVYGPPGCGKSTLLRSMSGAVPGPPSIMEGEVRIYGEVRREPRTDIIRVGPENGNRPDLNVMENVLLPFRWKVWRENLSTDDCLLRANQILDRVGLLPYLNRRPGQLSKDQNICLSLARALVLRPKALLIDDILDGMEWGRRSPLHSLLRLLVMQQPCVVVVATNYLPEALALADRVVVLTAAPGRVCYDKEIPKRLRRSTDWVCSPELARMRADIYEVLHGPEVSGRV
ncbi:MAG: ATP-binding cassette domain-containing protein [Myxococcales bacterium]|nr:ATP-binding cassette domain-containing protein [Myxococcales bacterium]